MTRKGEMCILFFEATRMKNTESVLQQSKASRWYRQWWFIAAVMILFLGGVVYSFRGSLFSSPEAETTPETYTVSRGDIKISVEGEGKIMNPNVVNLSFLTNGTLDQVLVEEGDKVKKGDVLAELDKRDLEFDLADAQNQVNIVNANIRTKRAEITDDSIRLAENDILVSQQNLEDTQQDLDQALEQALDLGKIQIETAFPEINKVLENVDDIFGIDKNYAKYEGVLHSFNDSIKKNIVKNQYEEVKREQNDLFREYAQSSPLREEDISRFLWKLKDISNDVHALLKNILDLFDGIGTIGANTTLSEINEAESAIKSALSSISSQITSLTSSRQKIDDAYLAHENGMRDAESSFKTTQIKLENSQLDYEKREISKEASLSVLYAQLSQAQVKVDKAKYNLSLATLVAPIDGEIIAVNGNAGETVKVESTSSENALIRILSDANFTTEIYVEEVDIAKIKKGQKAIITLDAIDGVELEGEVSYIASTATIDNNGITTYLVRVDIVDSHDAPIKEGMTTYVEFLLQSAENALLIPSEVLRGTRVSLANGESVRVETGVTDGQSTEIVSGLTEGQEILLSPQLQGRKNISSEGGQDMTEERMARIESLMREQGTLPEGWDSMSLSEKQAALRALRESNSGFGLGGGRRPR